MMVSIPGVDYSWSHPTPTALKAAGKQFACRYLSTDTTKNLTAAEATALAAAGIWCVAVWESAPGGSLGGAAAGAADAKEAAALATGCGMPSSRPIYFAVDFDATTAQQGVINAYLDGVASVLGHSRVGIYGGYRPVKAALDAGAAAWAWQTTAWSGGQWDPRTVIRQGAQTTIGGVAVDLNTAYTSDYGQWMPGTAPQEDDMTPAQAQQLQDLHDNLTSIGSLTEKDAKGQRVSHAAGYFLAHVEQDTAQLGQQVTALTTAVAAVQAQAAANGAQLTRALSALGAISTAVSAGGSADGIVTAVKTALAAWHPTVTITG